MSFANWLRSLDRSFTGHSFRHPHDSLRGHRRTARLSLEPLEERTLLSTFTVLNAGDNGGVNPAPYAGTGTLRQAIVDANAAAGPDTIAFAIPGTGVHTISPTSQLPDITDPVIIDGYTQPGSSPNSNGPGLGDNAVLQIELDGSAAGSTASGLTVTAGDSTIRGLAINRFAQFGIFLTTNGNNTIAGNFIGTDPSGASAEGNLDSGVLIGWYGQQSNGNAVGGLTPEARNVISGNGSVNLHIEPSSGNLIQGNFIGTDASGTVALNTAAGFRSGVFVFAGDNNIIGGTSANARNLISGNSGGTGNGVELFADDSVGGNQVLGNYIGTDVTGTFAVPNQIGVNSASGLNGVPTIIGGTTPGAGNLISGNSNIGASFIHGIAQGNLIGTDASGVSSIANGSGVFLNSNSTLGGTSAAARNIVSGNIANGVFMANGGNVVQGNYVGTDITGTAALGNGAQGVFPFNDSNSIIGGATAGARNVIAASAVRDVLLINSTAITIQGNYLGVDQSGNVPLTRVANFNASVVEIDPGNTDILIGGSAPGAGNVIGNGYVGIGIFGTTTSGIVVQGNSIGVGADGVSPIANSLAAVHLFGGTTNNLIGGTAPGAGNIIANGLNTGVLLDQYFLAPPTTGNAILGNSIYNTAALSFTDAGLGIDINRTDLAQDPDGPNSNDPLDADAGNNNLQNYPVLTDVVSGAGSTTIQGTLNSTPNGMFRVEFFANSTVKGNGYAEGEHYLGFTCVTTDANGDGSFNVSLVTASTASQFITATATDSAGNTSEFSLAYQAPALVPSSLSGTVFADFNDDGQIDFGEQGLAGVAIALTGTDDLGQSVNLSQRTDADGAYVFLGLRPGSYTLTETQPAGYTQGINTLGTAGGAQTLDQFFVTLAGGVDGLNYNYGERPAATGAVQKGQTATIGFWNNKNGRALILALNGGTGTQLGDWLAATLPNSFGTHAGGNNLTGRSNAYVADLFQQDFLVKGVKLDAQVLATALSVYATNAALDPTQVAARYGFTVSGTGLGAATANVGSNGAAFGVANNTTLTILDLLRATDAQTVNGLLYNGNTARRNAANNVYDAVNERGDI